MKLSEYAELCAIAYDGGKPFKIIDDLSYGVIRIGGKQKVVFRGSSNAENWLRDFSIWPVRGRDGYLVHAGFDGAFRSLYANIARDIDNSSDVEFTGHSLGGSIAELFAAFWHCRAVTFGAAKCYYRFCAVPVVNEDQIVCDDDPVPKLRVVTGKYAIVRNQFILPDTDGQRVEPEDHNIRDYYKRLIERGM